MNKQQMIDKAIDDLGGVYPVTINGLNYLIKSTFNNPYWGGGKYRTYKYPEYFGPSWQHICTRKEFEDRVEELNNMKKWNGKGLPPVGAECELSNCNNQYVWCKIRFMGDELCVVDHNNYNEQHYHLGSVKFRPIQSERDKVVEHICSHLTNPNKESIEFMYDKGWINTESLILPK